MKKIFLGILFYSVIIMPSNQLDASVSVNFAEYCPLHVGNSWTLVDEFGTTYSHRVVGTEFIDGKETYQYTNWEGNPDYANLTYENGALVIAGLDGTALDPPRIYDGQDIANPFVHIVFEIVPSVNTPAGIFYEVIKETIYSKIDGQEFITRVQYFAKGVGLIKDEDWCADCGETHLYTALLETSILNTNWMFCIRSEEKSFCDDSVSKENIAMEIPIVQTGDNITITFPNVPEDQVLEGRSSNRSVGAWDHDGNQITILSAIISDDYNKMCGHITFSDIHECPDAGTGTAQFWAFKGVTDSGICDGDFDLDGDFDGTDLAAFASKYGKICE